MTARKSERLLNLLITLLVSRSYVTKERIRSVVEQYRDAGDEAFEKMFERDKEELRSLGIPVEVGYLDRAFEDEPGYRVERSAFELPRIDLEPDEAAVLGLAARVWQHAGLAAATSDALVKLKAAGVQVDRTVLSAVAPQLTVAEPAFEALWAATQRRTPVAFGYRTAASSETAERHLQPWGVVSFRGRWYAVGLDTDRGEPRLFRLSRVQGEVRTTGEPGAFEVPDGTDLRALTQSLAPAPAEHRAVLLVRPGAGHGLRRRAQQITQPVTQAGVDPRVQAEVQPIEAEGQGSEAAARVPSRGWDRVEVDYGRTDAMADEILGFAGDVVVEAPPDLRELVVTRLRRVVAQTTELGSR